MSFEGLRNRTKNTFRHIFVSEKEAFNLNLVVVRAPFHDISLKQYQEKITDLENFMTMIAASVKLNEELIRALPADQKVYTCGIRELLNFDAAFSAVKTKNVFPLLARYDQFIEHHVQRESYNGIEVQTIDAGHVTAAIDASALRTHIRGVLEK